MNTPAKTAGGCRGYPVRSACGGGRGTGVVGAAEEEEPAAAADAAGGGGGEGDEGQALAGGGGGGGDEGREGGPGQGGRVEQPHVVDRPCA